MNVKCVRWWRHALVGGILVVAVLAAVWPRPPKWKDWTERPRVLTEVVCLVWVRPEVSVKKAYKKFADNDEIKEIVSRIAASQPGPPSAPGAEKHELRIYFLNGEIFRIPFTMEGGEFRTPDGHVITMGQGEFVSPYGRSKELYTLLSRKEEAEPFWGDLEPEEVEEIVPSLEKTYEEMRRKGMR